MKKLMALFMVLMFPRLLLAAPSNTVSVPSPAVSGNTISSAEYNNNNNEIQSKYNAHTHTDITSLGTVTSGTWAGGIVGKSYGGTGNAYGLGLPSGAIFFMLSGSCPSGTTDVTSSYTDRYLRINATANQTGGSDTHTHTFTTDGSAHAQTQISPSGSGWQFFDEGSSLHTHTGNTSNSSNVYPSYFTCTVCRVD